MNISTGNFKIEGACQYCSTENNQIAHYGRCPNIKAIEYYENGQVKRVEFIEPRGFSYSCPIVTYETYDYFKPQFSPALAPAVWTTTTNNSEEYFVASSNYYE